jgi:hypothetical protein
MRNTYRLSRSILAAEDEGPLLWAAPFSKVAKAFLTAPDLVHAISGRLASGNESEHHSPTPYILRKSVCVESLANGSAIAVGVPLRSCRPCRRPSRTTRAPWRGPVPRRNRSRKAARG